jgi:hypothetical protein
MYPLRTRNLFSSIRETAFLLDSSFRERTSAGKQTSSAANIEAGPLHFTEEIFFEDLRILSGQVIAKAKAAAM